MKPVQPVNTRKRVRSRSKSPRERVRAFLGLFGREEKILILINPDPDSMASALAVKRLLWKNVKNTTIAYIGEIQRLENQAMMELLKIPMVKIGKVVPERFHRFILVDSQPHHSEIFEKYTYDAIIDHHPLERAWNVRYLDIRPDYGATATMLIEYLRGWGIRPTTQLATALLYAIKTDTANFERGATPADVEQFRYVFQYANLNRLQKIEKSELRVKDLEYFQIALENRILKKKRLYAHLGLMPSTDLSVQIADFFMRVYGIGWSFVSGVSKGRLTIIIRNDGDRKDAGKLATHAFGAFGSAGGHRAAARAEIPLDSLRKRGIGTDESALVEFVRARLKC